jgi:ubiquinone/menaquinone biosynthesis C-methylase UbiE
MQTACAIHADVQRPGGLALTDLALSLCRLPAGARVLDVGCGTGAAVGLMRARYGYDAVGIDPAAAHAYCVRGLAESLPAQDASFDGVLSECVLSILTDSGQALREMHRVLAPGGFVMLSDVYDMTRPRELPVLLARCGFTIQLFQDHSRSLREYAAAAALQGKSCTESFPAHVRPRQAGYCLIIARKE